VIFVTSFGNGDHGFQTGEGGEFQLSTNFYVVFRYSGVGRA